MTGARELLRDEHDIEMPPRLKPELAPWYRAAVQEVRRAAAGRIELPPAPATLHVKCQWCPCSFESRESLNRHIGHKHPERAR